jgi:hypothetical protein
MSALVPGKFERGKICRRIALVRQRRPTRYDSAPREKTIINDTRCSAAGRRWYRGGWEGRKERERERERESE